MNGRNMRIRERRERLDNELAEKRVAEDVNRKLDELLEDTLENIEERLAEIEEEDEELGEDILDFYDFLEDYPGDVLEVRAKKVDDALLRLGYPELSEGDDEV